MIRNNWVVYIVRCSDNSLYCGITNDLSTRLKGHNSGKGAKYTRSRRPVELIGISHEMTKGEALKLEYKIKRLPAGKKLSELTGKETEMTLKQDLKSLQKEIKALEKKMDKLAVAIEKSEKPKAAKKAPAKKTPAKKAAKSTATERVLGIIKRSKKGVNAATLVRRRGLMLRRSRTFYSGHINRGKSRERERGFMWAFDPKNFIQK